MNIQIVRRYAAVAFLGSITALTAVAQAPAAPAAPAPAPGGPGGRGGGGGGRGGVQYSPAQLMAIASMDTTKETAAVTAARTALNAASFKLSVTKRELQDKADALGKASLDLALKSAGEYARVTKGLTLTKEQTDAIKANNGLQRGGLSSPGGTIPYEDYTGFTKIFDGKTFTGWSGETDGWIIGDDALQFATARLAGQHHILFMGLPGVSPILKDFDFKVEMRVASQGGYNGGIQYRSRLLSAAHSNDGKARSMYDAATIADPFGKMFPADITSIAAATKAGLVPAGADNPWQVSGYQMDLTLAFGGMGSLYEGQGRGVVANAGEFIQLYPDGIKFVIGHSAETPAQFNKPQGEWNQLEIIARANNLIHMINGHIVMVATDDDPVRRAFQGMLSLQDEGGEIWYRNVYLKHLTPVVVNTVPDAAKK